MLPQLKRSCPSPSLAALNAPNALLWSSCRKLILHASICNANPVVTRSRFGFVQPLYPVPPQQTLHRRILRQPNLERRLRQHAPPLGPRPFRNLLRRPHPLHLAQPRYQRHSSIHRHLPLRQQHHRLAKHLSERSPFLPFLSRMHRELTPCRLPHQREKPNRLMTLTKNRRDLVSNPKQSWSSTPSLANEASHVRSKHRIAGWRLP